MTVNKRSGHIITYSYINESRALQYGVDFVSVIFSNIAELSLEVRVFFVGSRVE